MGETESTSRYRLTLSELERSAHVPLDEQVEGVPSSPNPDPLSDDWVRMQQFLRYVGFG